MFRPSRPRQPLHASARRRALRWALGAIGLGVGLLMLAAVASSATAPRVHAAGAGLVLLALLAAIGTGSAPLMPLSALVAGFAVSRTSSQRGEVAAAEALGTGPFRAWVSLAPLWALLAASCLLLGYGAEPAAWRALHRVRGAPLAATVAWAGLSQGEVRGLGEGGALFVARGELRFTSADRSWSGGARRVEPADAASWKAEGVVLEERGRGAWTIDSMALTLEDQRRDRWLAPPTSPWSLSLPDLAARDDGRSALVLHRRAALAAAVPLLALIGWLLGWAPGGRRQAGRWWRAPAVAVVAATLFAVARASDHAVAQGRIGGGLAGWLPALAACVVTGLLALRWRRL